MRVSLPHLLRYLPVVDDVVPLLYRRTVQVPLDLVPVEEESRREILVPLGILEPSRALVVYDLLQIRASVSLVEAVRYDPSVRDSSLVLLSGLVVQVCENRLDLPVIPLFRVSLARARVCVYIFFIFFTFLYVVSCWLVVG